MMQNNLRRMIQRNLGKRFKHHREIDDSIRATGLTNTHVIRNPT